MRKKENDKFEREEGKADRWPGLNKGGRRGTNFCRETSAFKGRGTVRCEKSSARFAELTREKRRREVAKDCGGHGFFQRLSLSRESGSE